MFPQLRPGYIAPSTPVPHMKAAYLIYLKVGILPSILKISIFVRPENRPFNQDEIAPSRGKY
jgi:hypothetical protein